jgi:hypothetical protein
MKKSTLIIYKWTFAIMFSGLTILSGCKKTYTENYKDLLGTWVSTDLTDTIQFTTDHDLYKLYSGKPDHFDYGLKKDIITIRYNGAMYIYIFPTNHAYKLNGNELTIDFRPDCFGFRRQEIKFIR